MATDISGTMVNARCRCYFLPSTSKPGRGEANRADVRLNDPPCANAWAKSIVERGRVAELTGNPGWNAGDAGARSKRLTLPWARDLHRDAMLVIGLLVAIA